LAAAGSTIAAEDSPWRTQKVIKSPLVRFNYLHTMKIYTLLATCVAISVVGCSSEARDQYTNAGNDVGNAAADTTEAIVTDAQKTKFAADNALKTSSVKSSMQAAEGLDTSNLNVDSDTENKTITLNGTVPDAAQLKQADQIANGIAGKEFRVVNNLKVAPKSK
jgi:hyperosmotically inducible periplasmic protein